MSRGLRRQWTIRARGRIEVFTPSAFGDHFGTPPPDTSKGARLVALRFAVRDIGALQAAYRPAMRRMMNHTVPWLACQYPTAALAQEAKQAGAG